jgi:hypothetical protein
MARAEQTISSHPPADLFRNSYLRIRSRRDLYSWPSDQSSPLSASRGLRHPCHDVGPVFLEPGHGLGPIDDALEGFPGWVLQGFRLQSLRRILNEVVQAFVSSPALKRICNRCAGPSSLGQIDNARSASLAEPGCGIELDAADIIGGMASSVDHWILRSPANNLR